MLTKPCLLRLALLVHPDKNKHTSAAEAFTAVTDAFELACRCVVEQAEACAEAEPAAGGSERVRAGAKGMWGAGGELNEQRCYADVERDIQRFEARMVAQMAAARAALERQRAARVASAAERSALEAATRRAAAAELERPEAVEALTQRSDSWRSFRTRGGGRGGRGAGVKRRRDDGHEAGSAGCERAVGGRDGGRAPD